MHEEAVRAISSIAAKRNEIYTYPHMLNYLLCTYFSVIGSLLNLVFAAKEENWRLLGLVFCHHLANLRSVHLTL